MTPRLRVDALVPPSHNDMVAEGYVDGECLLIVSQEDGFESLGVAILPRRDGKPWQVKYALVEELLQKCKDRLWELRRVPPEETGEGK